MLIPFEINDEFDTPFTKIDPNMQFYLESNNIKIQCVITILKTHLLKTFPNSGTEEDIINISYEYKSLPKHFDELQQYVHMLEYDFFCD